MTTKNTVHTKYKQLTKEDCFELQKCLERGQDQLELAMIHVNSYPRKMFGFRTPFTIFKAYADELLLSLNNSKAIAFEKVNLSPSLIKFK